MSYSSSSFYILSDRSWCSPGGSHLKLTQKSQATLRGLTGPGSPEDWELRGSLKDSAHLSSRVSASLRTTWTREGDSPKSPTKWRVSNFWDGTWSKLKVACYYLHKWKLVVWKHLHVTFSQRVCQECTMFSGDPNTWGPLLLLITHILGDHFTQWARKIGTKRGKNSLCKVCHISLSAFLLGMGSLFVKKRSTFS